MKNLENRLQPIQVLSGNALKIIACLTMFIDHLSKTVLFGVNSALLESGVLTGEQFAPIDDFIRFTLYGVGSIAFPLFCLLLTEGFVHTSNRKRYVKNMVLFALISELPFDLAFFTRYAKFDGTYPFYWGYQNVYFTLGLGLLTLWGMEYCSVRWEGRKIKAAVFQILTVTAACATATLISSDYGGQGIVFIAGFYLLRRSRLAQALGFLALYMLTTGNQPPIYTVIAALLILLYSGRRGKLKLKYFFYWFYPAHITLLYLTMLIINQFLPLWSLS